MASTAAPYYGGGFTPVEPYAFWSNAAPSLGSGIDVRVKEIDYAALRRLVGQWRRLSEFYYGDFYPLSAYSLDNTAWIAWQFDCPERGEGVVQAFRRAESPYELARFKLRGLVPEVRYRVTGIDGSPSLELTGKELIESGIPVSIATQPGAAVLVYQRQKP